MVSNAWVFAIVLQPDPARRFGTRKGDTVTLMDRRSFLKAIPAVAALPAFAADDVPVKLGFDTYSLRAFKWKAAQLIDFAGSLKLDTLQISSLDDYESKDPAYLAKIKDQAARYNIVIDGGMGCICPTSHSFSKNGAPARDRVLEGLKVAHAVGAKAMRCFMGSSADRSGALPLESAHREHRSRIEIGKARSARSEYQDRNREPRWRYAGARN